MPTIKATVYTLSMNGITYRFSDLTDCGTHYSARQVLNDNRLSLMYHRISKKDIAQATVTMEELRIK